LGNSASRKIGKKIKIEIAEVLVCAVRIQNCCSKKC